VIEWCKSVFWMLSECLSLRCLGENKLWRRSRHEMMGEENRCTPMNITTLMMVGEIEWLCR